MNIRNTVLVSAYNWDKEGQSLKLHAWDKKGAYLVDIIYRDDKNFSRGRKNSLTIDRRWIIANAIPGARTELHDYIQPIVCSFRFSLKLEIISFAVDWEAQLKQLEGLEAEANIRLQKRGVSSKFQAS